MDGVKTGLFYRRSDDVMIPLSERKGEQWIVTLIDGGGVHLQRYIDGKIDETYRIMDDAEGSVAILGAILGFEPPRAPLRRGRRAR